MSDINKKSTPNQMREFMGRMRNPKQMRNLDNTTHTPKSTQDYVKMIRNLTESENKETVYDQEMEEKKMLDFFSDLPVNIRFVDLEVYDNMIFWGGMVDGIIKFAYTVTADEDTSNVTFDYTDEFSPDNPENEEIIKRLELYYNKFYKYWQSNIIQK
jgi:hypothetical protein